MFDNSAAKGEWDLDKSHLPLRQPTPDPRIPSWQSGQTPQANKPCRRQTDGRCRSSDFKHPDLLQDVLCGVQSNYQNQKINKYCIFRQIISFYTLQTAATRKVYVQLLVPMFPGPGAAEKKDAQREAFSLLLARKPKAQGGFRGRQNGRRMATILSLELVSLWTLLSKPRRYSEKNTLPPYRYTCIYKHNKIGQIPSVSRINKAVWCKQRIGYMQLEGILCPC